MSEQPGGCMACSTCIGFKSVSKTGKFCARCSHPKAKHFEGEKPPVEHTLEARPSVASTALRRDNELKLFMDVDQSQFESQKMVSKMTPPAQRMSSNQNPLAKRSPMRKEKNRMSPPPPDTGKAQAASGGIAIISNGEKPVPVVPGPSLKERIAMYAAGCKATTSDTPPLPPSPNSRGSLKNSSHFKLFSSAATTAPAPAPSPKTPLSVGSPGSKGSTKKFFDSSPSISPKTPAALPRSSLNNGAGGDVPVASALPPGPPIVYIASPSATRKTSIKDRIEIYSRTASDSSESLASPVKGTPLASPKISPKKLPQTPTATVEDKKENESTATGADKVDGEAEVPETKPIPASDVAEPIPALDNAENVPVGSSPVGSPAERLSVKERAGTMTDMLSTDPRFGLHDDSGEAADEATVQESPLNHNNLDRPVVNQAARRRSSARKSKSHMVLEEIVAEDQANNPELFASTATGGVFPEVTSGTTDEASPTVPVVTAEESSTQ